jgi:integrase
MQNPLVIPFRDYAVAVLARSFARDRTIAGYRTLLGHLMPRLGTIQVGNITAVHAREALADLRRSGLAPKSVANALGVLRMVLREAGNSSADRIKVPVPDADVRALGACEARKLREVLRPGVVTDDAVLSLLGSGMRLAELERLREQDWDDGKGWATVACQAAGATKSGRTRVVDVATYAQPATTRLLVSGMPARRTLRRRLDALCAAAGVPRVRVHDLRHTRLTLLLLAGAPVLYVCAQAGHHDPAYTMRTYGHLVVASPEQRAAWADAA